MKISSQTQLNKLFSLIIFSSFSVSIVYSLSLTLIQSPMIIFIISFLWLLFLSIYKFNFTGIPIGRKALARGSIYLLLFSFFIFYITYFHQYVQYVYAATDTKIDMWINNTLNSNVSLTYPSASNVTAQINVSGVTITLLRNGSVVGSGSPTASEVINQLGGGVYNYTANFSGDANNNPSSRTQWLTINAASTSISLALNGTQGDVYFDPGVAVNATAWDSVGQGSLSILVNGTNVTTTGSSSAVTNITSYTNVASYNYTATLTSNNYTASTVTRYAIISPLNITCDAGGPYLTGSTIVVSGNVTNSTGSPRNTAVNISINVTNSKTTTSDSNGSYYVTFTGIDVGTYTVNGTANSTGSNNATCADSFSVQSAVATLVCRTKTITFTGTVVDSGNGNVITSGNVTSNIVGTNSTGTAVIGSNGQFSVSLSGCLNYGTRYLVTNVFDDTFGRRGWFYYIYVPT